MIKKINNHRNTQLYLLSYGVLLLSFLMPASSFIALGVVYTHYPLTSYPGWVVLGLLLLFLMIQVIFFLRTRKLAAWPGLIAGSYCSAYAIFQIRNGYFWFNNAGAHNSLVNKLGASFTPLAGLWLLAIGGAMLFTFAGQRMLRKKQASNGDRTSGLHS